MVWACSTRPWRFSAPSRQAPDHCTSWSRRPGCRGQPRTAWRWRWNTTSCWIATTPAVSSWAPPWSDWDGWRATAPVGRSSTPLPRYWSACATVRVRAPSSTYAQVTRGCAWLLSNLPTACAPSWPSGPSSPWIGDRRARCCPATPPAWSEGGLRASKNGSGGWRRSALRCGPAVRSWPRCRFRGPSSGPRASRAVATPRPCVTPARDIEAALGEADGRFPDRPLPGR